MKLVRELIGSVAIAGLVLFGAACGGETAKTTTSTGVGTGATTGGPTGTGDTLGGTTDDTGVADTGTGTPGTTDTGPGTTDTDDTGTGAPDTTDTTGDDTTTTDTGVDTGPAPGENHPCQESEAPNSNDADITACVCAEDTYCCENAWDFLCVQKVTDVCGVSCACEDLPAEVTACSEDADCDFCDDGDKCNGGYKCDGGTCVATPAVVCDSSGDKGCTKNTCSPISGECAMTGDESVCEDDKACTTDTCDAETGECSNTEIPECGTNHPCKAASTPGSNDDTITACACEADSYCCNFQWDGSCVNTAKKECGLTCDCATLDPTTTACESDSDCGFCDDDTNKCNGTWKCGEGGLCESVAPVVCDEALNNGCAKNTCNEFSGICELTGDDAGCDTDGDPATFDFCNTETGQCEVKVASCADQCGVYDATAPCFCDTSCFQFEDCCEDICDTCKTPCGAEDSEDLCEGKKEVEALCVDGGTTGEGGDDG